MSTHKLTVKIQAPAHELITRAFTILKDRIQERCLTAVVQGHAHATLVLATDSDLAPDAFRIDEVDHVTRIASGSPRGLIYGIGKFLRTSGYDGTFEPSSWRGTSVPQSSVRGMYFASHFHNWYHVASEEEITRYMEDLMLWGVNVFKVTFPFINLQDWNDPEAQTALEMASKYGRICKKLGLQFCIGINNTSFIGAPDHIRAQKLPSDQRLRGNCGHPICPSNPEGLDYLMENIRHLFKQFYDQFGDIGLDFVKFWPYDEGGCACEKCKPWGCNGFFNFARQITKMGREYFPGMQAILCTWVFDTPYEGEWPGLTTAMGKDGNWVDYILADSHTDFPRYPLDVGVPGNLPLLNFPEISMWGNLPWGGWGAHPLPDRFGRLWDQVKHVVKGGFPYSEGIYEDMNKAIVVQFYWDRDQTAQETLKEYIAYEFGAGVTQDVLAIVEILEDSATCDRTDEPVNKQNVQCAFELADAVNGRLPNWGRKSWRWEILSLRTVLDRERFVVGSIQTPEAQSAMARLMEIYHCQMETHDPYHHRVRPLFKQALSLGGED
ncbi:MAG: hypothetical protein JKX85_08695 [Phycisphaeraceae bacterium]|nr:hypothetical protein [Phycisphaeraceae bacterium]